MKNKIFHTQDLCLRTNLRCPEERARKILTGPVRELILAQMAGSMSLGRLVAALIEGFIYLSLAGGVWCIGYMLSSHFRED